MTCHECEWCWKDEEDSYPRCHWEGLEGWDTPPCEQEEEYKEEAW